MAEVLIADDSDYTRRLLRAVLAEDHAVVDAVANGVEAVEAYEDRQPDLVVLSARLLIRDGIDATAAITDGDPDVAVVVCASERDGEVFQEATEAGAGAVLTKPFGRSGLRAAIQQAMAG